MRKSEYAMLDIEMSLFFSSFVALVEIVSGNKYEQI